MYRTFKWTHYRGLFRKGAPGIRRRLFFMPRYTRRLKTLHVVVPVICLVFRHERGNLRIIVSVHCHSHLTHYLSYGRVKSLFTLHWPDSYQLLVAVTWITCTTHCHVTMSPVAAAFLRTLQRLGADVIWNVVTERYQFCFSRRLPLEYLKFTMLFMSYFLLSL